jgi:hypothetical protein
MTLEELVLKHSRHEHGALGGRLIIDVEVLLEWMIEQAEQGKVSLSVVEVVR